MKIISWNVNGFRSRMNQSFLETFTSLDADVYCLQETRLQAGEGGIDVPGYQQYWNYAERKGYAGTALLTMKKPQAVYCGVGQEAFDNEGRVITADYGSFYLINCYGPNAASDLSRLEARVQWDEALLSLLRTLDEEKPLILCGDLNVAYNTTDLTSNHQGMQVPGFTQEERSGIAAILHAGFVDAYRYFHPNEKAGAFAYRKGIRASGVDYFIVSERMIPQIADCRVHNRIRTSDHWPMELTVLE